MILISTLMIEDMEKRAMLDSLYRLYKKRMWYMANQILNDPQEAEDAVHNAFIGIAKNIDHISDVNSYNTLAYVITSAKHAALNIAQREHYTNVYSFENFSNLEDVKTSYKIEKSEQKSIILSVLRKLPDTYRDILFLYYYEDLSEKEIAKLLDKNYSTVRKQISRAKKMFAELFEKEDR